jgi:hypothetical protein
MPMFTKTVRNSLAAALAFGGLAFAAPTMAAPLSRDAGLQPGSSDIHTVQYGYGHGHGGWGHRGFGPHHHHHGGWGRGHHYGWRHHGFGPRHHHHGGWGHRHGHGRW